MSHILFLQIVSAFTGSLSPEGDKDLMLADTKTKKLAWVNRSDLEKDTDANLVEYDLDKKSLKVNKKLICSNAVNKTTSFCNNEYIFTQWEAVAEDGKYKFRDENGFCLSVGKKNNSFNPVIIAKCKAHDIYQQFDYEKEHKDKSKVETIKNEYNQEGPLILDMTLKAYDDSTPADIIIYDSKDGNKRISTSIGELKSLYPIPNTEQINHDMLVDVTNKNRRLKTN